MSAANLDAYDLSQVDLDGEIKEDVLEQLIRVDEWDNPFMNYLGGRKTGNRVGLNVCGQRQHWGMLVALSRTTTHSAISVRPIPDLSSARTPRQAGPSRD